MVCKRQNSKTQAHGPQAGFHCCTCVVCGMTYCPGEEADEELHAAHHAKLIKGIRFYVSPQPVSSAGALGDSCILYTQCT